MSMHRVDSTAMLSMLLLIEGTTRSFSCCYNTTPMSMHRVDSIAMLSKLLLKEGTARSSRFCKLEIC
ncbi:hypothetical protein EV356DRAFT_131689 [Viridothelium virens]|uniref:Secreted protein n=1 Tax=Viridothelium virens TaxID=1048519 RepID=A0A6A6GRL8_VIRVR|nr:hypothetical protein EV356DRAFT_131689 [Viridothelium virens]